MAKMVTLTYLLRWGRIMSKKLDIGLIKRQANIPRLRAVVRHDATLDFISGLTTPVPIHPSNTGFSGILWSLQMKFLCCSEHLCGTSSPWWILVAWQPIAASVSPHMLF